MSPLSPLKRPSLSARSIRFLSATSLTLLLGACASMQDIPAGTPISEIQARHGSPTIECTLPDGKTNMIWSTQPMGQYAWSTQVAPDGSSSGVSQILTDAAFRQVEVGSWTTEQLQCTFGPPAEVDAVGLPSVRQTVWSYRYKQSGVWNSLMHIYVSPDGVVQRMHPGPDPLYEAPEWPFFF